MALNLQLNSDDSLRSSSVIFFDLLPSPPAFMVAHLNWNRPVNPWTINVNIFHVFVGQTANVDCENDTADFFGLRVFGQRSIIQHQGQ